MADMKTYFEEPTQVEFYWNDENGETDGDYIGGIAYCDEVICGCCGGTISIKEIIEDAPVGITPIIPLKWIDINEEIKGD